jgi:hypothetical protein
MTKVSKLRLVANSAAQGFNRLTNSWFGQGGLKHNYYKDFGFPETLGFNDLYNMYRRNGIARAAVDKTAGKTWQSAPYLQEFQRDAGEKAPETVLEKAIRQKFDDLRIWQALKECDSRAMVGSYSALILRFADGESFDQPVGSLQGLDALVEVIPAWEGQLTVSQWGTDERNADTYGKPLMYQYNEGNVPTGRQQVRNATIHPDRVLIWSEDGQVGGTPKMEAAYNDLISLSKIIGAGGEGFWKNAKGAPIFEVVADQSLENIAKASGVAVDEFADKMDEQVEDFQKGFDNVLMVQGMAVKPYQVQLADPLNFFLIALQSFAAAWNIPLKVLVGSQTGERASTEDAGEWNETNDARRTNYVVPCIFSLVRRFEELGILPDKDWHLSWTSLIDGTPQQKIDRAYKMADINMKMKDSGQLVYSIDEMRAVTDYEPMEEPMELPGSDDSEASAIAPPADPSEDPADA